MDENSNLRSTGDEPLLLITETASPLSSERLEEGLVSIISNFLALFDLVPLKLDGQKTTKQRSLLFLESRTFFYLFAFFLRKTRFTSATGSKLRVAFEEHPRISHVNKARKTLLEATEQNMKIMGQ